MITAAIATITIFVCFFLIGIGYVLTGKKIKGSCGGVAIRKNGDSEECGFCGRKDPENCENSPT